MSGSSRSDDVTGKAVSSFVTLKNTSNPQRTAIGTPLLQAGSHSYTEDVTVDTAEITIGGVNEVPQKYEVDLYQLTERDAFDAMALFLTQFAERAGDDLLTLLSDITIGPDGATFDPAAWDDWISCVDIVKKGAS
jgi:hypothetical protein